MASDYEDPFCINVGKIYGTLDDLRCESPRVQAKLIAAAKALIASTDIDGFRIDTPMQVPLGFFKAWAPEIKRYAAEELGKSNFGLWGEFFVEVGRYATMTGRGKDNTMYGNSTAFIDETFTLNGGIDYAYYHYFRHVLLRRDISSVSSLCSSAPVAPSLSLFTSGFPPGPANWPLDGLLPNAC